MRRRETGVSKMGIYVEEGAKWSENVERRVKEKQK